MLQSFDAARLPATRWRNGGGATREIACWPPEAAIDDFDWRLSIATIAAPGPFSAFPGIDRTIVLLDGDGVRLRSADGRIDHRLDRPHAPFAFAGEAAVEGELLGGASTDFNAMVRRGRWRAELQVLDGAGVGDAPASDHGLLLALRGHWQARLGDTDWQGAAGEGLCWADEPLGAVRLKPDTAQARLLHLRLLPLP